MNSQSCAITGFRPGKFHFGYDEEHLDCVELKRQMKVRMEAIVANGVICFLSGMAQGVDMWAAEIVLEMKKQNPAIQLWAILPCRMQAGRWRPRERERYHAILSQADHTVLISEAYTDTCMMDRNRYMVDHAEYVFAVSDGRVTSGTAATIRYARQQNKKLIILNPCEARIPKRQ